MRCCWCLQTSRSFDRDVPFYKQVSGLAKCYECRRSYWQAWPSHGISEISLLGPNMKFSCATVIGTFKPHVQLLVMVYMKVLTGLVTNWRIEAKTILSRIFDIFRRITRMLILSIWNWEQNLKNDGWFIYSWHLR